MKFRCLFLAIILLSICSCKKDPPKSIPSINTTAATDITDTTAVAGGDITSDGNSPITERGVCWSTNHIPTIMDNKTTDGSGSGSYISFITGLLPDITYNIRAYASNNIGTAYGNLIVFRTKEELSTETDNKPTGLIMPTLEELQKIPTIESVDFLLFPKMKSAGSLPESVSLLTPTPGDQEKYNSCVGWTIGYGMMSMLFRSIEGRDEHMSEWTFSPHYIWNQINNGINTGVSLIRAFELVKNQGCCSIRYMFYAVNEKTQPSENARMFALNYKLNFYRSEKKNIETIKKLLSNNYPIAIGLAVDNSFKKNDNKQFEKKSDGRLVWKEYKDIPRYNHAMLICGYDDNITSFKVLNSWSTDWGNMGFFWLDYDFFKTRVVSIGDNVYIEPAIFLGVVERPEISTINVFEISDNSAKSGGIISSDRGHEITTKGICWNTLPNPTISNFKTTDGSGLDQFNSTLTGLLPSTTYYVKAYATNSQGTAYGYQSIFTTKEEISLPTVSTTKVTTYTSSTATVGGEVTNDGGATVTERGIYWGTNYLVNGTKLQIGSNLGAFSSSLTGLTPNTTYYIKAYAINSQGASYGSQVSFTTGQNLSLATVYTTAATNVTTTGATLGGNVTSDGNASVTEKGVVYSTTQNPTTSNTKVSSGRGTGAFTVNVSSLSANTNYYVRAYAINSQGTAYGSQVNFTTGVIPAAAFSATPATITAGQSVQFTDQSTNSPTSWNWTFGDGAASTLRNPSHTYVTPGNYTVSLTAANSFGSNTQTKTNYITVNPAGYPPVSAFTATPTSTTIGQSVQFTDQSTNSPTSWNWNFGDGGTSTTTNPSYTYVAAGTYTVSLTATNSFGSNTQTKTNYITVNSSGSTVTDIDGNVYNTVTIGTQIWMRENLKTTRYRNGDLIGTTTPATLYTSTQSSPKYQWAYAGNESNVATYGRLYTWFAATDSRKICPTGWHLPTDAEWATLTTFLGGERVAGDKLKETGTGHWSSPNTGATNSSGFTALPGGIRDSDGTFDYVGGHGFWWSSTEKDTHNAWYRSMGYHTSSARRNTYPSSYGLSVRCVKD